MFFYCLIAFISIKINIITFFCCRDVIGVKIKQNSNLKAKCEIEFGEHMTKESKLEKLVRELFGELNEKMDQGFKELKSDMKEVKEAVFELQTEAKNHGWNIQKTISNPTE